MGRNTATRVKTTTSVSIKNVRYATSSNARNPWALNSCRRPWNRQLLRSAGEPLRGRQTTRRPGRALDQAQALGRARWRALLPRQQALPSLVGPSQDALARTLE